MWAGFEVGRKGCHIPPHTLIFKHVQNITTHMLGYGPRKSATLSRRREKGGQAIKSHRQGLLPILRHFKRGFTDTSVHILRTVQVQPPWGPAWGRTVLNSQEEQSFSTSSKVQCIHSRVEVPYLQKHLIVLERGKEYYREVKKQNDMRFGTKSKWVWPERLLPWGA